MPPNAASRIGQSYKDPVDSPHPWQNLSPVMMRVPHLAQKPEVVAGTGADGPWCACWAGAPWAGACRMRMESLCLRASSSTAAIRQISASQPEAVCRKLWRSTHSPPELNIAAVSLHDGRLEADARYTTADTAEPVIAFVKVGVLLNRIFMSRT